VRERFCLVHDDVMNFLLETATEVTARIRLDDEKKTVAKGALWYEESLPTETILSGVVAVTPTPHIRKELDSAAIFQVLEKLTAKPLQFGGKSTVGRGVCRLRLQKGA
jgi:CRISPR-associated protein Cmr4